MATDAMLDQEAYVARPAEEEAWRAYVEQELVDAEKQVRKGGVCAGVEGSEGLESHVRQTRHCLR